MAHYIHQMPGRLRVRVPEVKGKPAQASKLAASIQRLDGVTSVETNPRTGSVLILYEEGLTGAAPLLALLNVTVPPPMAKPHTQVTAEKIPGAAAWYVLEKALERSVAVILAALI